MSVVPNMNKLEHNRASLHKATIAEKDKLESLLVRKRNLEHKRSQPESGFFARRKISSELKTLNKNIAATKLRANSLNAQGVAAKKLINNAREANRRARGALIPGNNGYGLKKSNNGTKNVVAPVKTMAHRQWTPEEVALLPYLRYK